MTHWKTFAIGCSLALAVLLLFAQHKSSMSNPNLYRAVIDLTHNLDGHSPNWEGTAKSPFEAKVLGDIDRDGYYSRIFTTQEHYGTHLDAPAHFAKGMWTVDQIPTERLVRPLVVLDVRVKAKDNPDYEVSVQDVADWESVHGPVPNGAVVMAYTGWDVRWSSQKEFQNLGSDHLAHYPGYSLETAKFLVQDARRSRAWHRHHERGRRLNHHLSRPPVHVQRKRVSLGERSQPRTRTSLRSDGCCSSHQAGKRFGGPGASAGAGEVKAAFRHSLLAFRFVPTIHNCHPERCEVAACD